MTLYQMQHVCSVCWRDLELYLLTVSAQTKVTRGVVKLRSDPVTATVIASLFIVMSSTLHLD